MMRDTIAGIDLGVGRPAEIEASTLVDSAPLDVLDVEMMPMPAEVARRLAEALTAAADRLQSSTPRAKTRRGPTPATGKTPGAGPSARTSGSGAPEGGDLTVQVGV